MGVYGSQDSILDLTNERDPWLFNPSTRAPSGVLEDAVAVIESTVSRAVEAEHPTPSANHIHVVSDEILGQKRQKLVSQAETITTGYGVQEIR
ncbi:hypothetical protein PV325_002383 [Microctonus aethiopoides]|nr:hypothetical protein PV325_002383 [Microctonus aethiopoides]